MARKHKNAENTQARPFEPVAPTGPTTRSPGLPEDSLQRKAAPVFSGVLAYFPDALAEVAALSRAGNDKHNPGEPLHWSKEKSADDDDCIIRHALNVAKGDVFDESYPGQAIRHRAAMAWRALAGLQRELDAEALARSGK